MSLYICVLCLLSASNVFGINFENSTDYLPGITTTHLWMNTTNTGWNQSSVSMPTSAENVDKIPIYLGGYFSHGGVWDCSGILPAVEMALDHVNARSDILPNYDLRMVWNDTQVCFT